MAKKSSEPKFPVNPELEAAVIARAEEDAPRLMYADWLDDHGDPDRAAFIRTQVALWDKNPADADYVELLNRAEELESRDAARPEPKLPRNCNLDIAFGDTIGIADHGDKFLRGFPFFLSHSGKPEHFKTVLPALFKTTTIRGFTVSPQKLRYLAAEPYRRGVQALCFDERTIFEQATEPGAVKFDAALAQQLVAANFGPALKWLELGSLDSAGAGALARANTALRPSRVASSLYSVEPDDATAFLSSPLVSEVRDLHCSFSAANATGARSLAGLSALHTLRFQDAEVALPNLAAGGRFPALARLALFRTGLRGAGAKALAKAKMPQLAVLEFSNCELENPDVVALANTPLFDRLRVLGFKSARLGDNALRAIAKSDSAKTLHSFALTWGNPGAAGLRALATACPELRALRLDRTKSKLGYKDVAKFLSALACPRLEVLDVDFPLDDAGAIALANNPALASLRKLKFENKKADGEALTARGLKALFTSKVLTNLVQLEVQSADVGDADELLLDPGVLPNLYYLGLNVTDAIAKKLLKARPELLWMESV